MEEPFLVSYFRRMFQKISKENLVSKKQMHEAWHDVHDEFEPF